MRLPLPLPPRAWAGAAPSRSLALHGFLQHVGNHRT